METLEQEITKEINFGNIETQTTQDSITQLNNTIKSYLTNLNQLNLNPNFPKNIKIITNPEEFLEMIKLRSKIFSPINGFNQEYPEQIPGLQFDKFDQYSINLIHKTNNKINAAIRLIIDSNLGIQSKNKFSTQTIPSQLRKQYISHTNPLAEISRVIVTPENRGNKLTTKLIKSCATINET